MCGCGGKTNHATATPEQLVAAAQQRADAKRATVQREIESQRQAVVNAGV